MRLFSKTGLFLLFLFLSASAAQSLPLQSSADSVVFAREDSVLVTQGKPQEIGGYFYRVFFVTALLILLLFSFLFFYKKFGGKGLAPNRSKIHILSRQNLTPKQTLFIVAIEGKKYVLGASDHSVHLITELGEVSESELPVNDIKQVSQNFTSVLSKLIKK